MRPACVGSESASSDQVARLMRLFLGEGIVNVFTFMGQNNVVANTWWRYQRFHCTRIPYMLEF